MFSRERALPRSQSEMTSSVTTPEITQSLIIYLALALSQTQGGREQARLSPHLGAAPSPRPVAEQTKLLQDPSAAPTLFTQQAPCGL